MILTLADGSKREIPDDLMAKFIAENGQPIQPKPADFFRQALAPTSKEEYIKLCGFNQFIDLYIPELNRFLSARLASMAETPAAK
jgi:hypothetical protein